MRRDDPTGRLYVMNMPRLSALLIRTALVYFGIGFTLGMLMLFNKGVPFETSMWRLLPMHIEFLLFGWTVQFIFGVGFWILPRFDNERPREWLVWAAFALLNLGVLGVGVGSWLAASPLIIVIGRGLELIAVIAFVIHAYPRVKPLMGGV